jgi:hypothetical protein
MMDDDSDPRRRYLDEYSATVDRHREGASWYEARAIDFVLNAFRAVTYLNGGGLVAIPTVVALFQANPNQARVELIRAAGCFVLGLLLVVGAQATAFFTMARRAESEILLQHQQMAIAAARNYPGTEEQQAAKYRDAEGYANHSAGKIYRSNRWRHAGIGLFWCSVLAFIGGCYFGARAVLP